MPPSAICLATAEGVCASTQNGARRLLVVLTVAEACG